VSSTAERELRTIARGNDPDVKLAHPVPEDPWLVLRAAGSLGAVDLILARHNRVLLLEVKSTGKTLADGSAVYDMTASAGRGLEQRDILTTLATEHELSPGVFEIGFAIRRKGRLPAGMPRWTWHPRPRIHDKTRLHARDAAPLLPHIHSPGFCCPEGEHT
jgi:hypothetical protein